jgi:hypothetical protein
MRLPPSRELRRRLRPWGRRAGARGIVRFPTRAYRKFSPTGWMMWVTGPLYKRVFKAPISFPELEAVPKSVLTRPMRRPKGILLRWREQTIRWWPSRKPGWVPRARRARRSMSTSWSSPRTCDRQAAFLARNAKYRVKFGVSNRFFPQVFAAMSVLMRSQYSEIKQTESPSDRIRCQRWEFDLPSLLTQPMPGRPPDGPLSGSRRHAHGDPVRGQYPVFGGSVLLRMGRDPNGLKYSTFSFFHSEATSPANAMVR